MGMGMETKMGANAMRNDLTSYDILNIPRPFLFTEILTHTDDIQFL